jgi:glycosyltransferase involved in cell wall biosynthesis
MKRRITVSIGIPTFNEEQNIAALLQSVIDQKTKKVNITKIVVLSDNSIDKTHEIVLSFAKKNKRIMLIRKRTRKGKYLRMNELFETCTTDVLVVLDADIAMKGDRFIEKLVSALISDPKALTVSARNILIRPEGFMARVLHAHFTMWDIILLSMPHFESASQFLGTATAFRGSYARTLHIPANVTNPHLFLYLDPKSKGGFRFCTRAEVLQYAPSTMNEVKTVLVRAIMKPDEELNKMFGKEMIQKYQFVPRKLKMKVIVHSFLQNPFYTPFAIIMTMYIGWLGKHSQGSKSQLWTINASTKKRIVYAK